MINNRISFLLSLFLTAFPGGAVVVAQNAPTATLSPAGLVTFTADKLLRKRFFLIEGSLANNQSLIEKIKNQPLVSRDCYYRSVNASESLIAWLKENDCESVYCRKLGQEDVDCVKEFQIAKAKAEEELHPRDNFALQWLTVYLDDRIRDGFFRRQQEMLKDVVESSKAKVVSSVMTDRDGVGYFTDVKPGTYVISNILPTEFENSSLVWNCELTVPSKEPMKWKCEKVTRSFPACGGEKQPSASALRR